MKWTKTRGDMSTFVAEQGRQVFKNFHNFDLPHNFEEEYLALSMVHK